MENPKDRARRHLKNKTKYKGKSKSLSIDNKPKIKKSEKLKLGSNWDRYDDNPDENSTRTGIMDFTILANNPISCGSHFTFKNEKDILHQDGNSSNKSIFNLDLNLLENSLSCIAFNERSGIKLESFSESQKDDIQKRAENNQKIYMNYLENYRKIISKDYLSDDDQASTTQEDTSSDSEEDNVSEIVNSLDNINLLKQDDISTKPENKGDLDLEKWLDDILDS